MVSYFLANLFSCIAGFVIMTRLMPHVPLQEEEYKVIPITTKITGVCFWFALFTAGLAGLNCLVLTGLYVLATQGYFISPLVVMLIDRTSLLGVTITLVIAVIQSKYILNN